jgi:hypothetical protein
MTNWTGMITRGRTRPRTRIVVLLAAIAAAAPALAGCGSSSSSGGDAAHLGKLIEGSLQQHPGFSVRSVHCPSSFKQAKGDHHRRRGRRVPHVLFLIRGIALGTPVGA